MRGIMDAYSDPLVRRLVVMSSSQVGKTELLLNIIGYHIHQDPTAVLVVQPNERPMGEDFAKNRLGKMIEAMPELRSRVRRAGGKGGDQSTILNKIFTGGYVTIVGAKSPAGLAARPIRVVLLDEVDRYILEVGDEGGAPDVAVQRTQNFWNHKIVSVSTPTVKGSSRIEAEWKRSDQRRFFVPCPDCGHMQPLFFDKGIHWEKDVDEDTGKPIRHHPETAAYTCQECGVLIPGSTKRAMREAGEWRATNSDGGFPGFHISALYSPWVSWAALVEEFLEKKDDPLRLKTFVNLKLGEPWEDRNEGFEPEELGTRAEMYEAEVPKPVGVLTAAVDVQDDRLELAIWGWGERQECWLIAHHRIHGDPETDDTVWGRLEHFLSKPYEHGAGGEIRVWVCGIDSGYLQETVFEFVRSREPRVLALKGQDNRAKQLLHQPTRKNKHGVKPVTIATWSYKDELFRRLAIQRPGPRYIHFPEGRDGAPDAEFYAQFGREVPVTREGRHGKVTTGYKTVGRNEAVDLFVYGQAVLHFLTPAVYDHLGEYAKQFAGPGEKGKGDKGQEPDEQPGNQRRGGWQSGWSV